MLDEKLFERDKLKRNYNFYSLKLNWMFFFTTKKLHFKKILHNYATVLSDISLALSLEWYLIFLKLKKILPNLKDEKLNICKNSTRHYIYTNIVTFLKLNK